jgi:hypothetical protein
MLRSRKFLLICFFQILPGFLVENAFSQGNAFVLYEYLSPVAFSSFNSPETVIVIRFGEKIDIFSLQNELLEVSGDISGNHAGKFSISQDYLTLIFTPVQIFNYGEKVSVHLKQGIKTQSGKFLPAFDFWFAIRQKLNSNLSADISESRSDLDGLNDLYGQITSKKGSKLSFLNSRFPKITISDQPTPGNILTTLIKNSISYLYIFDNKANPLYLRIMPHSIYNLKPQPSGRVTYYDNFIKGFIELDSSLDATDTLFMKNGYKADSHEILLLENGHIILFSYDPEIVDMSKIVSGGNPYATVTGLVIQELDANKNLIFQWRSWDHFNITDSYADLLYSVIDYVHGNSLDVDTDTTLILSSRNMNEVTKINRKNGQIIWRLGGKNNEFVFINDSRQFAGQHSAIMQKKGFLTLFDNGVGLDPLYSRGVEYEMDEINKTVNLTHEYRHNPDFYANISGNLQRLDNGNTFIFWGPAIDHSKQYISESDKTGSTIFEARFDSIIYPTYRAYRSSYEPQIFTFSTDTLLIECVVQNTTLYRTFDIKNNSGRRININSAYQKNLGFYVTTLPITIEAGSKATVTVAFPSYSPGLVSDSIFFCEETDSLIVSRSLFVSINNYSVTGNENQIQPVFKVKPNPGEGDFYIDLPGSEKFLIKVINLSGRIIYTAEVAGAEKYDIDLKNNPDGLYLLYLEEVSTGTVHTIKLIKQK